MGSLQHISIIGWPFLACMGGVFVSSLVAAVRWRGRKRMLRWGARAASVPVAALVVITAVNAYYAYIPSIGGLLGQRALYQASHAEVGKAIRAARMGAARLPAHGMVTLVHIPAPASGFQARSAQAYLPRRWFEHPRPHLPVLMLLHGTPGSPLDWTRAGAVDVLAERWAAAHNGAAPIIVMPDSNGSFRADSECVNGHLGRAETYLTVDVPQWIIHQLGGSTRRREWAIGGLSSGGTCALQLALRHPGRFSTFLAFGAEGRISNRHGLSYLFARPARTAAQLALQHSPSSLLASYRRDDRLPLQGWIEAARNDGAIGREATVLSGVARRHGLPTNLRLLAGGGHTFHVWRRSITDAYPWLMERIADQRDGAQAPERPSARSGCLCVRAGIG